MCELLAMSCRHPARLTSSLTALASHAEGTSRNRDGWGLAFFQGRDLALYRGTEAADTSSMVRWLEACGPRTKLALGYIRHATQGGIELANTAPFVRELNGRIHGFTHNGNLAHLFDDAAPTKGHYRPVGTTDSELAFCGLLSLMEKQAAPLHDLPPLDARLAAVAEMAGVLRRFGPANFLYSDGDTLFAHADRRLQPATGRVEPPGLYRLTCPRQSSSELLERPRSPESDAAQRAILLASVPLTDGDWMPMPQGSIIAIRDGEQVAERQI
ncbi:class II glutamine amidotransferase [Halomonas sp. ATCH28]|uniref:Class II glutamine amidotransferase n=1 Tax=Halomonas gemina TaxID=2945105 RepID=A0ABT0T1M3_9GAMM|nr:class II glutamine amidotransferase [Halomonas gemina]MCL7940773.1 class II glutamine amidotransferase [Halomonas gemina]